jgi:uncharacterized protein (TIGR03437 family)
MFTSGLCAGLAIPAAAQTFDTSGNSKLNGDYFVRQVITTNLDSSTSAIGEAISITGIMTFDGQGGYTFNGQKMDSMVPGSATAYSVTNGTYAVESNGMAQIQNLLDHTDTEYGAVTGVGPASIVASATEGAYNDVFVAIQAGSGATNSSVSGSYAVGFIDFLQANAGYVRDGFYTLTSSGNGSLGSVNVNGAMANQNSDNITQTFPGVTYSITSANGAGTLTFPTASTPLTALVSGQKTFYVSADGTLLLGGDPNGFDLIIGIKSLSGSAANTLYQGTYFNAALENDASDEANGNNNIDSFYGSTLALGSQGTTISHERLAYFDTAASDYTTDGSFNFASDGTYNDSTYQYIMGVNGLAVLVVGTGTTYSMSVNLSAQLSQATSVFIDPLSIFNAASYGPITNPVAPGEFVTIFGLGLSTSTQGAQTLPLPTTLGKTKVTVNGRPAPLDFVSPTQINLLVPFETSESFATFQVMNNDAPSNQVTVYTSLTAPGVFTLENVDGTTYTAGIGPAAVLHYPDYSLVTSENPAVAGETLILYLTGLGAVTPTVSDGAPGPSSPPSTANEFTSQSISIDIFDSNGVDSTATVSFAGLAPFYAGLYQINFVVPSGVASGLAYLNISTNEAYTSEAKLFIQ